MPTQAQVAPSQRFKVIKQEGHTINLKVEGTEEMSAPAKTNEGAITAIPNLSGTVMGQVSSVDQGTITIKEDTSQTEYELRASPDKLKDVSPGYRVEAKAVNGRVLSLTILGMPMQAQPDPSQKFKVIVK
jgi:copper chaperone CopZ